MFTIINILQPELGKIVIFIQRQNVMTVINNLNDRRKQALYALEACQLADS